MKKIVLIAIILIIALFSCTALAEGVFAFEELEYTLAPGKSVKLEPIAQNIDEKLKLKWKTEDKSIGSTSNGVFTASKPGETNVRCTATTESGKEYVAIAKIVVINPVKKIQVEETNVNMFAGGTYKINAVALPEDATNKEIEWSSSDEDSFHVFEDGKIISLRAGKATITGTAKDGSGTKVKINVSTPALVVTDKQITITEKEGYLFGYQINASGISTMGTTGDVFYTEDEDVEYQSYSYKSPTWMRIIPVKAGTGTIWFNINGAKTSVKVKVEHSAVYDSVSYPLTTINDILNSKNPVSEKQISLKGKVVKTETDGEDLYVYAKEGEHYFNFVVDISDEEDFKKGMEVTVYGICKNITEYKTETGLTFLCVEMREGMVEWIE